MKSDFRYRQATQSVGPWSGVEWVVMLVCVLIVLLLVVVVGVPMTGLPG